jgi:hypothetical protein
MHHGTRHLSISGLSSYLYLPIIVANPRTNPSPLKGSGRWSIPQRATYLDAKHDGVDGSTDEVLPTTTYRKAGLGQKEGGRSPHKYSPSWWRYYLGKTEKAGQATIFLFWQLWSFTGLILPYMLTLWCYFHKACF